MTTTATHEVPLSSGQKVRLLVECLPFLFMLAGLIFALTVLDEITGAPASPALLLFLGLVCLVTGWTAIQRVRDVASGVAAVREDRLERSWRARSGQGTGRFYGKFEQIGQLRLVPKAHFRSSQGRRYRVVYSPASKIVWALEPADKTTTS